jgi:hypothetical protein
MRRLRRLRKKVPYGHKYQLQPFHVNIEFRESVRQAVKCQQKCKVEIFDVSLFVHIEIFSIRLRPYGSSYPEPLSNVKLLFAHEGKLEPFRV